MTTKQPSLARSAGEQWLNLASRIFPIRTLEPKPLLQAWVVYSQAIDFDVENQVMWKVLAMTLPSTRLRIDLVVAPTWDVTELVARHFEMMQAQTPSESCHVMSADDLFAAGVNLYALREHDVILGIAAFKLLETGHCELKSMHTRAEARGKGVGSALVQHILAEAAGLGISRVSLETGSEEPFAPARRLYQRHGFSYCTPFSDYVDDPLSVFMTRQI
ncbi:MAG: GNAT family N-acetyltransferase [Pelagibaca sp.]